MSFGERVTYSDERLGDHPDRIKSPQELLKYKGQNVYIVVSPFGNDENIGTCFIWEWDVGNITDHHGKKVTRKLKIDLSAKNRYLCYGVTHEDCGISLKDYNVVPNNYNNNCIFSTKDAAEAYVMYRKLQYAEDQSIANIENKYSHFFTIEHVANLLLRGQGKIKDALDAVEEKSKENA